MPIVQDNELSHVVVTGPDQVPTRWAVFLHGILGTKQNLRSLAKNLVAKDWTWGGLLVDLRMHGESQKFSPPHTLAACAEDLRAHLARIGIARADAIIGHSFGGKVAMAYADHVNGDLGELIVLDSNPGVRNGGRGSESTLEVLDALDRIGTRFSSREDFLGAIAAQGQGKMIAQWLAMNVSRHGEGDYRFDLNTQAIREMLNDYFAQDLWPVIESPRGTMHTTFVLGKRSPVFNADDHARLAAAQQAHPDRIAVDVLPEAGHWVHVDAFDRVNEIILQRVHG